MQVTVVSEGNTQCQSADDMKMAWSTTNTTTTKQHTDKASEAEAGNIGHLEQECPGSAEHQRAELLGTIRILSHWPVQLARAFILILLSAIVGVLFALLLRIAIPVLFQPGVKTEPEHLHVVTTNLTATRACALEALTREHAPRPCNLVLLQSHPDKALRMVWRLNSKYPNLNTHYHTDPEDFFQGSPLDGITKVSQVSDSLMELAARTLALWRHGGISVDLDRPVMQLPPSGQYVQQDQGALLQFPQPCHPALQGLLDALGRENNADDAMVRATSWICRLKEPEKDVTPEKTEITTEKPKPEQCLGVNVVDASHSREATKSNDLHCPVVTTIHEHETTTLDKQESSTTYKPPLQKPKLIVVHAHKEVRVIKNMNGEEEFHNEK